MMEFFVTVFSGPRMNKIGLNTLLNPFIWKCIRFVLGPPSIVYIQLKKVRSFHLKQRDDFALRMREELADCIVRSGPFKGMQYPSLDATGSALYPKILGTYEQELSDVLGIIMKTDYASILDIGCAEGYYAVGLGRHFGPKVKITAYDTNPKARILCGKMAKTNGVDLQIEGFCDREELITRTETGRHLVIMDCEGYEGELIDTALATQLRQCDFLVECHDFRVFGMTDRIRKVLTATHDLTLVRSIDDMIKAQEYQNDYVNEHAFDYAERYRLFREGRPNIMQWVFARAREQDVEKTP